MEFCENIHVLTQLQYDTADADAGENMPEHNPKQEISLRTNKQFIIMCNWLLQLCEDRYNVLSYH